jgi:hypothetical protein
MRYMIGSQMTWAIVPALILVGAAYVWVVSRLLSRKQPEVSMRDQKPTVQKAA